ncbi:MAG: hypothetical protein PHI66_05275 [Candidatus Pacebacteria bacterium]|nr:hypothetical protein [Candidatus Paceibacterota bacterium]
MNDNVNIVSVYGNWTNAGTFNCGNGIVIFGGISNATFISGSSNYYNVHINKIALDSSYDSLTVSGIAIVSGSLIHTNGRFYSGQINLAGNYIIGSSAGGGTIIIN